MTLIDTALELWTTIATGMSDVYDVLITPLKDLFSVDIPIISSVVDFIINNLNIGDNTVLDLMFGVGIPFVIIFGITKWLIDILP